MRDMVVAVAFILTLVYMILLWIGFHKHWFVIYWDFASGIGKELLVCFFLGVLMAAATLCFWPVLDIVIGVFAYFQHKKATTPEKKKIIIIFAAVLAIIVAVIGIMAWVTTGDRTSADPSASTAIMTEYSA